VKLLVNPYSRKVRLKVKALRRERQNQLPEALVVWFALPTTPQTTAWQLRTDLTLQASVPSRKEPGEHKYFLALAAQNAVTRITYIGLRSF